MSRRSTLTALSFAALFSLSAQAASQIDQVQLNCSSALSIDGISALSLRCDGDFSLIGVNGQGRIEADEALSFWAAGALGFQGVALSAPTVSISSNTSIAMDSSTLINGNAALLQSSPLVPSPSGSTIGIGSASSRGSAASTSNPVVMSSAGSIGVVSGNDISLNPASPVPEPSTAGLGLAALMLWNLRRWVRSRSH